MSLFGEVRPFLSEYGTLAVSAALLFEHFGLPLPGETMLIAAAVLAAEGTIEIVPLLLAAWAAATIGNVIGFAIGRYGGRHLVERHGSRVGISSARLAQVESFFQRYGAIVLVGARFIVVLRQLSGIAAGTLTMPWGRFLVYNAVGAALWVAWWGLLSYWLGNRVFAFLHGIGRIEPILLTLAAFVLVGVAARIYWRRRGAKRP